MNLNVQWPCYAERTVFHNTPLCSALTFFLLPSSSWYPLYLRYSESKIVDVDSSCWASNSHLFFAFWPVTSLYSYNYPLQTVAFLAKVDSNTNIWAQILGIQFDRYIISSSHFTRAYDLLAMYFWPGLQHQMWIPSYRADLKCNQKAVDHSHGRLAAIAPVGTSCLASH